MTPMTTPVTSPPVVRSGAFFFWLLSMSPTLAVPVAARIRHVTEICRSALPLQGEPSSGAQGEVLVAGARPQSRPRSARIDP